MLWWGDCGHAEGIDFHGIDSVTDHAVCRLGGWMLTTPVRRTTSEPGTKWAK